MFLLHAAVQVPQGIIHPPALAGQGYGGQEVHDSNLEGICKNACGTRIWVQSCRHFMWKPTCQMCLTMCLKDFISATVQLCIHLVQGSKLPFEVAFKKLDKR